MAQDGALLKAARDEARSKMQSGEITTQEQYDTFMSGKGLSKPKAVASEATAMTGQAFRRRPELTKGEEAKGLARVLAQGATLGLARNVEPLFYAAPGGESMGEAKTRIGQEMAKYREGSPLLAPVAELAGNVATGAGLLRYGMKGAGAARTVARTLAGSGAAQGAISGAASVDGPAADRVKAALFGAAVGGTLGAAGGALVKRAVTSGGRAYSTGRLSVPPEVQMTEEAMGDLRMTPDQLRAQAQQLVSDSPESRVIDVLGQPGTRIGRRIEALGGEAGEQVSKTMGARLETKLARMAEIFPRITGKAREDVIQTIEDSIERGKTASAPLYKQFEAEAAKASPVLDDLVKTPFGQDVLARARRNAANERRSFIEPAIPSAPTGMIDAAGNPVMSAPKPAEYNPRSINDIKKAMDDVIYGSKYQNATGGTGGLLPGEVRAAKDLRVAFVDEADKLWPESFADARSAWAGESALRNAMSDAEELASRTAKPGEIKQYLNKLTSDSEKEYFQRGWLNAQVDKIEAGGLTPKQIRTPLYQKQVTEVFGSDAPQIIGALRAEVQLADAAGQIVGGARTAPLQADMQREMRSKAMEKARNVYTMVRNDPFYAGARAADIALETVRGPTRAAERVVKAKALMTPATDMGKLLDQVAQDYRFRQAGDVRGRVSRGALGAQSVRSAADAQSRKERQ